MQFTTFAATALLAASASAYKVLTPVLNSTVVKGQELDIKWSSVDTDADVFSVYISNFETNHWPPTIVSLAQNVARDDGSISLRIPCDLTSDFGWQINFINGTNTYVIYAQSARFKLTGNCIDPPPAPFPTGVYHNTTVTLPGTTITKQATATATVTKSVSTVIIATPIVWIVEPSAAPGATVYPTTCAANPTGPAGPGGKPTTTKGPAGPTGTGGLTPTKPPQFTGAASSLHVSGGLIAAVGAFALLL
jgi:hypothetical protein